MFLGQLIDSSGIRPDPGKVNAIQTMPTPTNMTELRQFLGMLNQLSKFAPNLADKTKPLQDLLIKTNTWIWGEAQQNCFKEVKQIITSTPVLALFNTEAETVVSADASSYGLGAVLQQKQPQSNFKPITYISRSLTTTEQQYAQLEKELLAFTWACERFADYLIGLRFHIHTDHKPLIPLFSTKNLEDLPVHIQRYRLRMMRFHFTISHVPGKQLTIADTLLRAPSDSPSTTDHTFEQESQIFVNAVIQSLPATKERLQQIRESQKRDATCIQLKQYCQFGWPEVLSKDIQPFQSVAAELSVENELLLKGSRIVIPTELWSEMLAKLHEGHLGITKCLARARQSVWWPGISQHLAEKVKNCVECPKNQIQRSEPMLPTPLPELPWQKVGTDLFQWKNTVVTI